MLLSLPGALITHARLVAWAPPVAAPWLDSLFLYGMLAAAAHLVALVTPRLHAAPFRIGVSVPGMTFIAAGALAGVWLLALLPLRAALWAFGWQTALDALRFQSTLSPALVRLDAPIVGADSAAQLAHWLVTLEQQWIKPAAGAFHVGTVSELDVVLTGRAKTLRYKARRLTLARRLRIWRAAPRLSTLLAPHFES